MKYEIIPSLLSVEKQAQRYADLLKGHVESIHIDVMDGIFVDGVSFSVRDTARIETGLKKIVHLMAVDPRGLAPEYALAGADTIIFHVEAAKDPAELISLIKEEGCRAGITLKPGTPIEKIMPFLDKVDIVLVMTVEPGQGGQEMKPEMILRIKELRDAAPSIDIMVDGGINSGTILQAKQAGANKFVVGSAIFRERDPIKNIKELCESLS